MRLDRTLKELMYRSIKDDVVTDEDGVWWPDWPLEDIPKAVKRAILYNPKLVQFKLDFGRVYLAKRESDPIRQYDWTNEHDRREILRIIMLANDGWPIVIKNAITHWPWHDFGHLGFKGLTQEYVHKWKDGTVDVLEANHRENWFMWHSEKGCGKSPWKDNYEVSARWDSVSLPEFFRRRDLYIISHKDSGGKDHDKFGFDDFDWKLPKPLYEAMKFEGADKGPWSWRASFRGQVSPLHIDHGASMLMQIYGKKHLLLWSRDDVLGGKMNIYPKSHCMFRRIIEDATSPDRRLFPHHDARGTIWMELGPGDIGYWPSMWPHYTTAMTNSVSVGKRSHARLHDDAYGSVMVDLEANIAPPWATVDEAEKRTMFAKGWATDRHRIFKEMENKGTYDDPNEWYVER